MPSRQPTHHGYAVNVKDHSHYGDFAPLTDDEVAAIYDDHAGDFWEEAQHIARDHGYAGTYGEGRMGGWAVPHPQPNTDDLEDYEVEVWVAQHFRPFERDILATLAATREDFLADIAEARVRAIAEPTEAAYWAARDVETI